MILKNEVLNYLIENDKPVSGQGIANHFNVSRGAIWKVIRSLNEDGYKISGKSNLGYYSDPNINIYSVNYLNKYLNQSFHIDIFDEVDSTSTYLKKIVYDYKLPSLAIAYKQTGGRGRTGKSFFSPPNGLYFSFAFKADDVSNLSLTTIKVGVAVLRAIESLFNIKCKIKWVNDIYYNNKKVGGILSEAIIDFESKQVDTICIGIGINLYVDKFPGNLKDVATSLDLKECNRNLLIATIINNFFDDSLNDEMLINEYKDKCVLLNKIVSFDINGKYYQGIAVDIDSEGHLIVNVDNNKMILNSGEVSLGSKVYE